MVSYKKYKLLFILLLISSTIFAAKKDKNHSIYKDYSKFKLVKMLEKSCRIDLLEDCHNKNNNIKNCGKKKNPYNCMNKKSCTFGTLLNCHQSAIFLKKMKGIPIVETKVKKDKKLSENVGKEKDVEEKKISELSRIKYKKPKVRAKRILWLACAAGDRISCIELKGKSDLQGSQLLLWTSILLFGLATFIVASFIFKEEEEYKAQEKLTDGETSKVSGAKGHGIVLQYSRPFFKRYLSPIVGSMKNKRKIKDKYKRSLASAGLTSYLTPEDFFAFKLFLILGFPVMFMAIREFLEETWSIKLIPVLAIAGFYYPNIWIKGKIEQRQKEILFSMPFSVDMLALSVEAGLDFIAAMAKVIKKAKPSALVEEFTILLKEIKIGASRADALRNMAWRTNLIQVASFCATLIAADSVGASIGPILKSLGAEMRQKRSSQIEKAGATAATKILFPMMFFIIPSVFIVVASPMILEFVYKKK